MTRVLPHAHSDWSYNGTLALEAWRDLAEARRFDAVLLAEHEETGWTTDRYEQYSAACADHSTTSVRLIPGIEFNQDGYHVLCYGLQRWPTRPSSIEQLAADVHAQGCVLCLAHPPRYRWTYPQALLNAADAVEVWNSIWVSDGSLGPHPRSLALAIGRFKFVGQDVHKPKHLSGLHIVTPSPDVLGDLRAQRFVIGLGGRRWRPDQLCEMTAGSNLQRFRTPALRSALKTYRWVRQRAGLIRSASAPDRGALEQGHVFRRGL